MRVRSGVLVILTKAYVLHTRAYKETSLLLELLTEKEGRMSVLAKGAKRPRSAFRGILDPFLPLLVEYRGNHDLKTLCRVDLEKVSPPLNAQGLIAGLYLNEILIRLLQRELAFPVLFLIYQDAINALRDNQPIDIILRYFEMDLLEQLGYGVFLKKQVNKELVCADKFYRYDPNFGLIAFNRLPYSVEERSRVFLGSSLLALENRMLETKEARLDAKRLMQWILREHLGSKPLISRTLWQARKQSPLKEKMDEKNTACFIGN